MRSEPVWLTGHDVAGINKNILAKDGHESVLRDRNGLESAVARPIHKWQYGEATSLLELAVSLLFGIARNHPFLDGNKRAGLVAAIAFLEINGWAVTSPDDPDELAERVVAVIEGRQTETAFAANWAIDVLPPPSDQGGMFE